MALLGVEQATAKWAQRTARPASRRLVILAPAIAR